MRLEKALCRFVELADAQADELSSFRVSARY
jgi:hypothetical protein